MRILLDYRPALRARTGVGEYAHQLATALARRLGSGDSLVLFSSSWKDRLAAGVIPGTSVVDARVPVTFLNLAWHRLEWPTIETFASDVDVVHSMHPLLMPAQRAAQVVTVHDLYFLDAPENTRAEIRRDYPALAGSHARRADAVITVSEYTAQQVRTRLGVDPERIAICPNGPPTWTPGGYNPRGHILFMGTIEPRKNVPTLLRAYAELLAREPDAPPLVLAGGLTTACGSVARRSLQIASRGPRPPRRVRKRRRTRAVLSRRVDGRVAVVRRRVWSTGARGHDDRRACRRVVARCAPGSCG